MSTAAFGFAASMDLQSPTSWPSTLQISCHPYAATPESASESQPLRDNHSVLLYDGRVDNREDLAHALGRPQLTNASDGQILQAAFAAWGARLTEKVIGEYAFVAIDLRNYQIVAGQDALGIRRLWYMHEQGRLWVTSNLRVLFDAFPRTQSGLDRAVFAEYFSALMMPWSGRTIWQGIHELRRGNVLVAKGNQVQEFKAWRPDPDRRRYFRATEELDEEFRRLLFEGVAKSMRATGDLLCDLSGGLDSSTTASAAALLAPTMTPQRAIHAWSTTSRRSKKEPHFQHAVSDAYGIRMHQLEIEDCPPFDVLELYPVPLGSLIQTGAMNRTMRAYCRTHGLTARITGHGADSLLQKGITAPIYLAEWLREGRLRDWARELWQHARIGTFSIWDLLSQCSVGTLNPRACTFERQPPEWLTRKFRAEMHSAFLRYLNEAERAFSSDARERLYRFTLAFVPASGQILPDERHPLLYRPLVEFLLSLDWKDQTRPMESRLIMRRALEGILPEAVRVGKADGQHGASLLEGFQRTWPRIEHLLTGACLADLGIVEKRAFRRAIESLRAGNNGQQQQYLLTALYLEMWLSLQQGARPREAFVSVA